MTIRRIRRIRGATPAMRLGTQIRDQAIGGMTNTSPASPLSFVVSTFAPGEEHAACSEDLEEEPWAQTILQSRYRNDPEARRFLDRLKWKPPVVHSDATITIHKCAKKKVRSWYAPTICQWRGEHACYARASGRYHAAGQNIAGFKSIKT